MSKGAIADMRQLGVRESFKSKLQVGAKLNLSLSFSVGTI
jgi:hypothetical protein